VPLRRVLAERALQWLIGVCALLHLTSYAVLPGDGIHTLSAQFDMRRFTLGGDVWHLIDPSFLRSAPLVALAHLHSQPPLYNVLSGVIWWMPAPLRAPCAAAALVAACVVIVVAAYALARHFAVRPGVAATVIGVFVVADPAMYLYGQVWSYTLFTAALVTLTAYYACRLAREATTRVAALYGVAAGALILTNSLYQIYLIALLSAPVIWVQRHQWRPVLRGLGVPMVVVALWYANDAVQFSSWSTSSWFGMNLARSTVGLDTAGDIAVLERQGVVSATASIPPFSPLAAYGALGHHGPTGVGVLSGPKSRYNNVAYLAISRRYLSDDIAWIAHRPALYARHMEIGLKIFFEPSDQLFQLAWQPSWRLAGYTAVYDHVVNLQANPYVEGGYPLIRAGSRPGLRQVSVTLVLEIALALALAPLGWLSRRRRDERAAALYLSALTGAVLVFTTLVEVGENNRFRFEMGAVPLVASLVALSWLGRWWPVFERMRASGADDVVDDVESDPPGTVESLTASLGDEAPS